MRELLYKEFRLSIHPFFLIIMPVLIGALALIPKWIFFFIPLYFCMISIPNILSSYQANNDLEFSAALPVPKREVVKARIAAFSILELIHVLSFLFFVGIHWLIYRTFDNYALNLNAAFVGLMLVLFGIVNLILFPLFFRSGYKVGIPAITANVAALLLAAGIELLAIFNMPFQRFTEQSTAGMTALLLFGLLFFPAAGFAAFHISAREFETVDL